MVHIDTTRLSQPQLTPLVWELIIKLILSTISDSSGEVFEHQFCDGKKDCSSGEDETKICENIIQSPNGCCKTLKFSSKNMICELDGTFEGSDIYKCENEFNYVFKQGENFVVGFLGDPREKSQIAWSHKVRFEISKFD